MGCLQGKEATQPSAADAPSHKRIDAAEAAWGGVAPPEPSERSRRKKKKKRGMNDESELATEGTSNTEGFSEITSENVSSTTTARRRKKKRGGEKKRKKKVGDKSEADASANNTPMDGGDAGAKESPRANAHPSEKNGNGGHAWGNGVADTPKKMHAPQLAIPSLHTPDPITDNSPAPGLLEASFTHQNGDENSRPGSTPHKDTNSNPLATRELSRSLSSQNSKKSRGSVTRSSIPKGSIVGRMPKKRDEEMLPANKIASITAWIGEQPTELFQDPADFFKKDRQDLPDRPPATEG